MFQIFYRRVNRSGTSWRFMTEFEKYENAIKEAKRIRNVYALFLITFGFTDDTEIEVCILDKTNDVRIVLQ